MPLRYRFSVLMSYQAIWKLVTLWIPIIPVEDEGCKWTYEISYIWTVKKDMNLWLIITVIHTTWSSCEIQAWKKFRPQRDLSRGHGFESRSGLNFFQALISQLCMIAMINRKIWICFVGSHLWGLSHNSTLTTYGSCLPDNTYGASHYWAISKIN